MLFFNIAFKNLIFDIVLDPKQAREKNKQEQMLSEIKKSIKREHPQYNCIITVDYDFINPEQSM